MRSMALVVAILGLAACGGETQETITPNENVLNLRVEGLKFVGHDAHVFRIEADTDIEAAARWPDFFPADGQQTPAPAKFVGGIHDMPQGTTGYFALELEPGEYGITAEIPDAMGKGFFQRFSVE